LRQSASCIQLRSGDSCIENMLWPFVELLLSLYHPGQTRPPCPPQAIGCGMSIFTCTPCLEGSHRRCSGRNQCACSVCASRPRVPLQVTKTVRPPRQPKPPKQRTPRVKAPVSDTERAKIAREYRERRAAGGTKTYANPLGAPGALAHASQLRSQGLTYRAIAQELDVDFSHLRRRLIAWESAQIESEATEVVTDPFE